MNLEDIARKAGVSRATVSRVINNASNVNPDTRAHVWDVIRQENFHPNPSARALVTQRTQIIGVVMLVPGNIFIADNNYHTQILAGVSQVTRQNDYAMLLWLGETWEEYELNKITHNRQMDGLIIASLEHNHPLFNRLETLKQPFVMIDRPLEHGSEFNYVTVDNVRAGEEATTHLIKMGRRRIAHITGHMEIADAQDRLQGYKNALTKADLPIDPNLIVPAQFFRKQGYDAMRQLLPSKPDALFAAGDTIAIGAIQAAQEAGLTVPDDLAVIGFDDVNVAAAFSPSLSTMRQPVQEKGRVAAQLLIDLIEDRIQGPKHILLPTELITRESTNGASVMNTKDKIMKSAHGKLSASIG
jgi:LacI family transcriptional regulator